MSDKPRVLISYDGWLGSEEKDAAAGEKRWVPALGRRDRPRAGAARRPVDRAAYRSMNNYNRDPTAKSYIAKTFKGKLDMWILVDGVYAGTFVVTADRADGERQDLALVGGWEIAIAHEVEVRFDGTGSGRATYIDGVSLSEGHRRHQFNDRDVGHRTLPGRWRRPATQTSPERLSSRGRLR